MLVTTYTQTTPSWFFDNPLLYTPSGSSNPPVFGCEHPPTPPLVSLRGAQAPFAGSLLYTLPIDALHTWIGPRGIQSQCRVRIGTHPVIGTVCVLTEVPTNTGVSVTEGIEHLVHTLVITYEGVLHRTDTLWMEHYPPCPHRPRAHYARVSWDCGNQVVWVPLEPSHAESMMPPFPPAEYDVAPLVCPLSVGHLVGVCTKRLRAGHQRRMSDYWDCGFLVPEQGLGIEPGGEDPDNPQDPSGAP